MKSGKSVSAMSSDDNDVLMICMAKKTKNKKAKILDPAVFHDRHHSNYIVANELNYIT